MKSLVVSEGTSTLVKIPESRMARLIESFHPFKEMDYVAITLAIYYKYNQIWNKKNISRLCNRAVREGYLIKINEGLFKLNSRLANDF